MSHDVWSAVVSPLPLPLSHMCGITRAGIKPLDFTVLNLFYLSFAGRLCFTEETHHLSAGPENKRHFAPCLWMKGYMLQNYYRAKPSYASRVRECNIGGITVSFMYSGNILYWSHTTPSSLLWHTLGWRAKENLRVWIWFSTLNPISSPFFVFFSHLKRPAIEKCTSVRKKGILTFMLCPLTSAVLQKSDKHCWIKSIEPAQLSFCCACRNIIPTCNFAKKKKRWCSQKGNWLNIHPVPCLALLQQKQCQWAEKVSLICPS